MPLPTVGNGEKSRGCMEAMISWDSPSVFFSKCQACCISEVRAGCESQEQSGRERRCFGGRGSFTPGSRGRGGGSTATVSCSFPVLQCPLGMAPAAPAIMAGGRGRPWLLSTAPGKRAVIEYPEGLRVGWGTTALWYQYCKTWMASPTGNAKHGTSSSRVGGFNEDKLFERLYISNTPIFPAWTQCMASCSLADG